jgi:type I restriction enzyme M protein
LQSSNQNTIMKEIDSNSKEVNNIINQAWRIFEVLRGSVRSEDLEITLFLLSVYNDRLIDNDSFIYQGDIIENFLEDVKKSKKYRSIVSIYAPIIDAISYQKKEEILHSLKAIDPFILQSHFSKIFDTLLYRLSDAQGKYSGEFIQPLEISRFIMNLANLQENATVYNPFAGLASFGTFLNHNQRYYGQEINHRTWALGMLRLMAYDHYNFNYDLDNSIEHWNNFGEFDLIVANPPYGLKIANHRSHSDYNEPGLTVEKFLIERGLESINNHGQLICVVSQGFLFRGGKEQRFREQLVKNGLIDTIISLPSGLLKHTGIPICIVVFKKSQSHNGFIRIVNANDFVISNGPRDKRLDDERLSNILKEDSENKYVKFVSTEEIREADFNLNVQRYFAKDYSGVRLSPEIGEHLRGSAITSNGEVGKFVRIRDLKDDVVDSFIDIVNIKEDKIPRFSKKIEESCLLLATRWKTLKPTYFEYRGAPIYISIDIIALKIDETRVDPHYLINELHSENILDQIGSFRIGGVIPRISREDLFNIKIELPSIEEQRGKVKGLKELSKKIEALQKERNALVHGKSIAQFDEFASLKHSLGAPRQNILSNAKSLERFFENNNSEAFTEVNNQYQKRYDISLIEVFQQIKEDINHISVMLEKGESGLILNNYPNEIQSLKNINKTINSYKENGYNFKITKYLLENEEFNKNGIECNMVLFKILLENILSNASKYGFSEKTPANEVVIEMKIIDNFLEVTIKNNGIPFPKNFDKAKFIAKFTTANIEKGTGLGGYDINRIASHFGNPDWDLILDKDGLYPVMFKFNFPIMQIENER